MLPKIDPRGSCCPKYIRGGHAAQNRSGGSPAEVATFSIDRGLVVATRSGGGLPLVHASRDAARAQIYFWRPFGACRRRTPRG